MLWPNDDAIEWYARHIPEERLAGEDSVDVLTWNVFRTFEMAGQSTFLANLLIGGWLKDRARTVMFPWALNFEDGLWEPFARAGEEHAPHMILFALNEALILIDANFGPATASTPLQSTYIESSWMKEVMSTTPPDCPQLSRNWLVGTKMAEELKVRFWLVSLTTEKAKREDDLTHRFFNAYCRGSDERQFVSFTWEAIGRAGPEKLGAPWGDGLFRYLSEKTLDGGRAFELG